MAKVLLIEDEKAMSDLIALKFKVENFEVDQAFNLAEAKEKLTSANYDAVLTDYLLPDGDLTDFLTGVRADSKYQNLPVIVMTNYVEDVNQEKLKSLGVSEIIVKYQVVPAQMVDKIKALIVTTATTPPVAPQEPQAAPAPIPQAPQASSSPADPQVPPVSGQPAADPLAAPAQSVTDKTPQGGV